MRYTSVMSDPVRRKPATSLANYDIELLATWYDAVLEAHGISLFHSLLLKFNTILDFESHPKLVVLMHEFEQYDPSVVQDILYICRSVFPPFSSTPAPI